MPSIDTYWRLLSGGLNLEKNHYQRFDAIETEDDLTSLFDVLRKYNDIHGRHPVITANTLTSNPDFERIKAANYREYYSELLTDTYNRYQACQNSFNLYKQGISENIFFPQLHGREHLNVPRWLRSLQKGDQLTLVAFDNQMIDLSTSDTILGKDSFMDALRYENQIDLDFIKLSLQEGQQQFEKLFGNKSLSFIAPRYTWNSDIESCLKAIGIRYLQGRAYQSIPKGTNVNNYTQKVNYLGRENEHGQIYLTRNVFFEPSASSNIDWTAKAMQEISTAFFWNKPAVICIHRVNFIGSISENNRKENLKKISRLFEAIIKRYPDVEFMNTVDLSLLIKKFV